jgi:hypothetical protein
VDLADGGGCQRPAHVRLTAVVAPVLGLRPVVELPTPLLVAAGTAAPELGVERVEHLAVELAQWKRSEDRSHVPLEVADVRLSCRLLEVDDVEVPVEQLVDRGLRPRVAPLVDLVKQTSADLLGLAAALGPGGTTSVRS